MTTNDALRTRNAAGVTMIRREHNGNGAEFSDCERFRYSLWRTWTDKGLSGNLCAFIGLNPSTATETEDDPTIRRCIRFCKDWGFDGYVMLNLFAFRATDPRDMKAQALHSFYANDVAILNWAGNCERVVCAWGNHGVHLDRANAVSDLLNSTGITLHHLGLTRSRQPKHPLYLRADTEPVLWS